MATRYWVGNSGHWYDTAHWSETSGGAGGASMPLYSDTAVFDANSFTLPDQTLTLYSRYPGTTKIYHPELDFSNVVNPPILHFMQYGSSFYTRIYIRGGSFICVDGMTFSYSNETIDAHYGLCFDGTVTDVHIDLAGNSFRGEIFVDDTVTNCYIDSDLVIEEFDMWATNCIFNCDNIHLSNFGYDDTYDWNAYFVVRGGVGDSGSISGNPINLIFDGCIGSNGVLLMARYAFTYGDITFGELPLYGEWPSDIYFEVWGGPSIAGTLTFETPTDSVGGTGYEVYLFNNSEPASTLTVSELIADGIEDGTIDLIGDPFEFVKTSGEVNLSYCQLSNIHASGGAVFNALASAGNVDNGGNTGWNFTVPPIEEELTESVFAFDYNSTFDLFFDENEDSAESGDDPAALCDYYTEEVDTADLFDVGSTAGIFFEAGESDLDGGDDSAAGLGIGVSDDAEASDFSKFGFGKTASDSAQAWDSLGWSWLKVAESEMELSDTTEAITAILVKESLSLKDLLSSLWEGTEALTETGFVYDTAQVANLYQQLVEDEADLTDTAKLILLLQILDALTLAGISASIGKFQHSAADSMEAVDEALRGFDLAVSDTFDAADAALVRFLAIIVLSDAAEAEDTATLTRVVNESVEDTMDLSPAVLLQQILNCVVEDELGLEVMVELDGEFWECWVLNTSQALPSVYSGFEFNSFCEHEGETYAAGAGGIYKLGGTTDAGTAIKPGIVLPESTFGIYREKRFRKASFGISGTAPAIRIETESGDKTYSITKARTLFSREQKGRKFTVKVADFEDLDFIELIPVILSS